MNRAEPLISPGYAAGLCVLCFGTFRLQDSEGNELRVRTRKARALLAYLALTERPAMREKLADLLWSDRAGEQGRASVRQALYDLRHLEGTAGVFAPGAVPTLDIVTRVPPTDLSLIRLAAESGDDRQLLRLLESSEPGLLTDMDGLDPEYDCWLRSERALEPSRTLQSALEAAKRCFARDGARAAQPIIAEIQRLDPGFEEAVRLMLRIDHELGDTGALHRHYELLREHLRQDYDAEPSQETVQLIEQLRQQPVIRRSLAPSRMEEQAQARLPRSSGRGRSVRQAAFLALPMAIGAFAWASSGRDVAATADSPLTVAVLPFEQQPNDGSFLAEGLWEQTRAALTRNRSLQVLGRSTTTAMARQDLAPEQIKARFGVTHLLEGSVRRTGTELLVSVSLSRTSDGVAVWQHVFRGRMGEPFAIQDAIANGIEGKVRGRLASGGGRRAEQIVTTPEVYGLYSEARALISSRQPHNIGRAEALLRSAVERDPNYAPAWSLLGAAIFFNGRLAIADSRQQEEAQAAVGRALALAPNLAQAHATLAVLEGDNSPAAEQPLRRAVALDPNYAEAWNWLGNSLGSQNRNGEAMAAYERAIAVDPLLEPAIKNLAGLATEMQDHAAVERLLRRITRAGASPALITGVKVDQLIRSGDYSGALRQLLQTGLTEKKRVPPALWATWLNALTGSGHYAAMHRITGCPEWYAPLLQGKILPPEHFGGRPVAPEEFWTSFYFSTPASRAMVNRGRSVELVRLYREAFRNVDDFISRTSRKALLADLAPTLAVALHATGAEEEAAYLLAAAANQLSAGLKRQRDREATAELAFVRAAQGERALALALLQSALRQGWLPDGRDQALNLAQEPAWRGFDGDPHFRNLRDRILRHVDRERAELGPITI